MNIRVAALNRRDQWMREGMYPAIRFGTVLGSDGYGLVEEGSPEWVGKHVIINPNVNWGDSQDVQSKDYSVLGMPNHGTLADYITVPSDRLHLKPEHLTDEEAAALPLAGLTAFRATIRKGQVTGKSKVLITGIGGGVSQLAFAFAVASEADVYVTSGSDVKIEKAVRGGASGGFNYTSDWVKADDASGFDAIIDSAGGNQLNNYLKIIKPGGRIVMYGSTAGYPEETDVFRLFWLQAQIMGSTMGSDLDFEEMLQFVSRHKIKPTVDKVFSMDDYLAAFDRFKSPDHFGKILIKM